MCKITINIENQLALIIITNFMIEAATLAFIFQSTLEHIYFFSKILYNGKFVSYNTANNIVFNSLLNDMG